MRDASVRFAALDSEIAEVEVVGDRGALAFAVEELGNSGPHVYHVGRSFARTMASWGP